MARIAGVNIPLNKRVEVGLTYIYGVGRSTSNQLLAQLGISPDTYVRDLTEDEVAKLRDSIDNDLTVEGDLRRERSQNVKRLMEIGLTYIYGIGRSQAQDVLKKTGVSPDTYVKDLTDDEVVKLRETIDNDLTVEGDLRRERSQNVKRLMEIGAYRGLRHRRGLPVRGQNTKTNARTRKGPKRMSVAGKKKATKK